MSTHWIGRIIEAVSGETLDAYLRNHVFDPLGMDDTGFILGEGQRELHPPRNANSQRLTHAVPLRHDRLRVAAPGLWTGNRRSPPGIDRMRERHVQKGFLPLNSVLERLIQSLNDFEVDGALALFAPNAVIVDESVGDAFEGAARVRNYIQKYFVQYNTVTRLESTEDLGVRRARAHVDFTGDFGHETGILDVTLDAEGRIIKIDASLT